MQRCGEPPVSVGGNTGSLYFPFTFWAGTELRPMQPYLNKLPAELVGLFPQLAGAAAAATAPPGIPSPPGPGTPGLGTAYRQAQVSPLPNGRQPFTVDPAIVERGLKGHADTQNELARILRGAGIEPRSRLPREPNFDLAWEADGTVFVAEIKASPTITRKNSSASGSARSCGTATTSNGTVALRLP